MEPYLSLVAALVGALIGAAASVATIIVQSKFQARRDLVKEAVGLALEDWKTRFGVLKEIGGEALPLSVFVHYHLKALELAENGGLTPEAIRKLSAEQEQVTATFREVREESRRRTKEGKNV
jgi:hypothetical protein